jgi:DNA-binding transcriptional regulator YiaG
VVRKCDRYTVEFGSANSGIRASGHSRSHRDTPALPFCHIVLKTKKPKDSAYPTEIRTIGDRLRARRMDLGLHQKEVAVRIGVSEDSVCYWEKNRVEPCQQMKEKIMKFIS